MVREVWICRKRIYQILKVLYQKSIKPIHKNEHQKNCGTISYLPEDRKSFAKNRTAFLVEGNVTTHLLGGCVSGGLGVSQNIRGAGFAGVIIGKVRLILGKERLVYSKLWGNHAQQTGIDPNYLPTTTNLASNYGFNAAAGGGDNRNVWENTLFINGIRLN